MTPATIVTACSAALAPLYNWLLVDKFGVGLAGAALANDAVQVALYSHTFKPCKTGRYRKSKPEAENKCRG